ncbi:FAD-dependent oxidoreductase [Humibacter soli]
MGKHQIIVLGGGYVGVTVVGQLARRMRSGEASVTLVTESETRDERMRWHQLATGQQYRLLPITETVEGSGAKVRIARAERIDLEHRAVLLSDGESLPFDSLVVALGSVIDFGDVPGAREHARGLTDTASVTATAQDLRALPDGARVVVIGGGLTGIELATEVAESYPRLRVTITSSRPAGDWLSGPGRRHLDGVLDRLGIDQVVGRTANIGNDAVTLADGRGLPSALTLWAGGFRANPLLEESGLQVDEVGRAYVDATFRTPSHPEVWVVGDAARVPGRDGVPLKMGCRTGAFMAITAPKKVAAQLAGDTPTPFSGRYFAECISLGRHEALLQWLSPTGDPVDRVITGRLAVMIKEGIQRGIQLAARHPGPYAPTRRRHVRDTVGGRREMIEA